MNFTEKHPGKLFVLSGPSGAGKGTICKQLLAETEDLELSVSMTTRAPRNGETEGISYYFTDKDTFIECIGRGDLLEYAQVYGKYNTTPYDKLVMDLMYIAHPSFLQDLQIMFATVKILFMKESTEGFAQATVQENGAGKKADEGKIA